MNHTVGGFDINGDDSCMIHHDTLLTRIDSNILRELQNDGRITYAELARRVGLTTTPCMERVKRMEKEGVIKGYTALLDADYLEAGLVVFVQIRLSRTSQDIFEQFKCPSHKN